MLSFYDQLTGGDAAASAHASTLCFLQREKNKRLFSQGRKVEGPGEQHTPGGGVGLVEPCQPAQTINSSLNPCPPNQGADGRH